MHFRGFKLIAVNGHMQVLVPRRNLEKMW